MADATLASYDEIPYLSLPFAATHPATVATVATLFGLRPAPVTGCRVLELGCASGANLLPMAEAFPGSQFVGIDLSRRQIEDGQRLVNELGLHNLELRHLSILDVDAQLGQFDYILAHGVFSWVPEQVQDKILSICSQQLRPSGIAYISYNTFPGWHAKSILRDMLRYHTQADTPHQRVVQAREVLGFLAKIREGPSGRFGQRYWSMMTADSAALSDLADSYLLHEHLDEMNRPCLFHEFVSRAETHGLSYLGEAEPGAMSVENFPAPVQEHLRQLAENVIQLEQYMDFLRNRPFRQTLLCHKEAAPSWSLSADVAFDLYVASSAWPVSPTVQIETAASEAFCTASGQTFHISDPLLKTALVLTTTKWPKSLHFDELYQALPLPLRTPTAARRTLAVHLIRGYLGGLCELHVHYSQFTTSVADRPRATPYSRLQARHGGPVTNRRHEVVSLEPAALEVLQHLNGERDRDQLAQVLKLSAAQLQEILEALAGSALLIDD